MPHSSRLRRRVAISLLSSWVVLGIVPPVAARPPAACDTVAATAASRAAEHASRRHDYADGARWFLTAAHDSDACPRPSAVLFEARALVEAAALLAETGDYLPALSAVRRARRRLEAVIARDPRGAAEARASLNEVIDLGSAIETIAQASM